jgi:hypothetical protein
LFFYIVLRWTKAGRTAKERDEERKNDETDEKEQESVTKIEMQSPDVILIGIQLKVTHLAGHREWSRSMVDRQSDRGAHTSPRCGESSQVRDARDPILTRILVGTMEGWSQKL